MTRKVLSWSLRRRVVAIALFVCVATLLAGGAAMYRADHIADRNVLDARLVTLAHTVLAFAEHEVEEEGWIKGFNDAVHEAEGALGTRYHYQIWSLDGKLLHQTHRAPSEHPMRPLSERGFGDAEVNGEPMRIYSEAASRSTGMLIQIAERMSDREAAVGITTGYFLAFLAIPLLLIFASTWWFLDRALHSIDGYASQLRDRHALDLTELDDANPPAELKPMIDSINTMFRRFRQALSVERNFTAVAAHEMRTPLAGLRAQAQWAASMTGSPRELAASLRNLMSGIDHASHLLNRLLDLARIDSLAAAGGHPIASVNLERIYLSVMSELGHAASERDIALNARFEVNELMAGELGLHMLMHNLLVNAIHFTPAGGRIDIGCVARGSDAIALTVDDSGPGIPASRRAEAFQRFNRLGRMDGHGVGLGLSIVLAVAEAHHAQVHLLESPLGGLRAEVRFPSAPTSVKPAATQAPGEPAHIWRAALRNVEVTGSSRY